MNESLKISRIVASRLKLLIGVAALFVGSLVYIIDRPPDHTYFVYIRDLNISLYKIFPNTFGVIGNSLPAFIQSSLWNNGMLMLPGSSGSTFFH